jgi:hypothetical protein
MVISRLENCYGACNEKEHDATGDREVGLGRDMSVQSQTRLHHVHTKISNRRLPQAETRSPTKGGIAPSWHGVKTDVGAFNRRQHTEVTTNAGEWVRANADYHNTEQRTWSLRYWLRRWVAANRQKIAVKWEMVCKWGRDWCGQGKPIA